jgi:Flp pilus assembly pilin Flp
MSYLLRWLPRGEKGQDLAEYALLIAVIAIVVYVAAQALGLNIVAVFNEIGTRIMGWLPLG